MTLIFPAVELLENKYGSVKYQIRERKVKTEENNQQSAEENEEDEDGNTPFMKNDNPRYVLWRSTSSTGIPGATAILYMSHK